MRKGIILLVLVACLLSTSGCPQIVAEEDPFLGPPFIEGDSFDYRPFYDETPYDDGGTYDGRLTDYFDNPFIYR